MRAHLGDQLVIESPATGAARRDGEIVGLHHEDGTPPYDVRWSDTDEVTLVFPGPDAHVQHLEHEQPGHTPQRDAGEASTAPTAAPAAGAPGPGDIGRRVAAERRRQGLTREETAGRARMSPGYLTYLEERAADPSLAALIRLADALGTTVAALRGGGIDLPLGQGHALLHPQLRDLGPEECRTLLSTHGVGRLAVTTSEGRPAVVPVNYEVVDDAIVFRTAPDSVPAAVAETEVAFEVDHVDDALSQGWSVLAVGPASVVTDPEAVRRLAQRAHTMPWAGGEREMWVSIRPTSLTGRRITPADG
ncbi:pyridoxamine 5'-phosphate oxidase family protein [Streptomyces sp. NPDC004561]